MKDTRAERITDTLVFQHRRITNPTVSVADAVTNAANDLTEAIKGNMDKQLKNVDIIELERLATIFQKAAEQVAENDVRTPRVPYTRAKSPRVSELIREEQDTESANVPRVDITSDNPVDDTPRYNTRHQKRLRGTPMTDALLTVMAGWQTTMPTTIGIEKVLESSTIGNDECSHGSRNRRHDGVQTFT
jgi:hypothetical protein